MVDEQKVLDNMNLVYHILHRFYPKYVRNEDVVQSGMLALCKAVETYDESYGTLFSTYAGRCIINGINTELRQIYRCASETSVDFSYEDDEDGNKFSMLNYIQVTDDDEINNVHINEFAKTLTEQEQTVFNYKQLGYTVTEISSLTGYGTHQNISLILKKIRRKWRQYNETKN